MEVNYKLDKVRELASGDEDFVAAIAVAFLEEVPVAVAQINEGLSSENYVQVHQNAHKIKPTIQMFDIAILEDVIALQDWGESEKENENMFDIQERFNAVINTVVLEIKSDFNL